MSDNKTVPTSKEAEAFIAAVEPASKREDARVLDAMFQRVTGEAPKPWGSILGYGQYHYKYESGREGDAFRAGFASKKAKHSLHLMGGYVDEAAGKKREEQLSRLGKHKTGASCIYINKLADVDLEVLEEIMRDDWAAMNRVYPG